MASRFADFFRIHAAEEADGGGDGEEGGEGASSAPPSLAGIPLGIPQGGQGLRPSFGLPVGGNPAARGLGGQKPPPPQYDAKVPYPGTYDFALNDVANVFNLPMFRTGCRMDLGHEFSARQVNSLRHARGAGLERTPGPELTFPTRSRPTGS